MRKAALLALPQVLPVAVDELVVFGRTRAGRADLAAVRRADLQRVASRQRSVKFSDDWIVPTPAAQKAQDRRLALSAGGIVAAVFSLIWIQFQALDLLDQRTTAYLQEGAAIRTAAKAAAERRNDTNIWASLRHARPEVRTPGSVLSTIASLSRLTPGDASWTKLTFGADQIAIEGTAKDPVAVLGAFSTTKDMSARFSRPVVPLGDGRQQFEISLTRNAQAGQ
jgi:hypothetical protein